MLSASLHSASAPVPAARPAHSTAPQWSRGGCSSRSVPILTSCSTSCLSESPPSAPAPVPVARPAHSISSRDDGAPAYSSVSGPQTLHCALPIRRRPIRVAAAPNSIQHRPTRRSESCHLAAPTPYSSALLTFSSTFRAVWCLPGGSDLCAPLVQTPCRLLSVLLARCLAHWQRSAFFTRWTIG